MAKKKSGVPTYSAQIVKQNVNLPYPPYDKTRSVETNIRFIYGYWSKFQAKVRYALQDFEMRKAFEKAKAEYDAVEALKAQDAEYAAQDPSYAAELKQSGIYLFDEVDEACAINPSIFEDLERFAAAAQNLTPRQVELATKWIGESNAGG